MRRVGWWFLERSRAEQSPEATRVRGRGMHKFKSTGQARKFVSAHTAVQNELTLAGTWLGLNTIGISGQLRLESGVGRLPEPRGQIFKVWMN